MYAMRENLKAFEKIKTLPLLFKTVKALLLSSGS